MEVKLIIAHYKINIHRGVVTIRGLIWTRDFGTKKCNRDCTIIQ